MDQTRHPGPGRELLRALRAIAATTRPVHRPPGHHDRRTRHLRGISNAAPFMDSKSCCCWVVNTASTFVVGGLAQFGHLRHRGFAVARLEQFTHLATHFVLGVLTSGVKLSTSDRPTVPSLAATSASERA